MQNEGLCSVEYLGSDRKLHNSNERRFVWAGEGQQGRSRPGTAGWQGAPGEVVNKASLGSAGYCP